MNTRYQVDIDQFYQGAFPFKKLAVCGTDKKPIHQLAVQCVAFLDPESAVSASGDYTIHLGPTKVLSGEKKSGGGALWCSCCLIFFLLLLSIGILIGVGIVTTNGMSLEALTHFKESYESHIHTQHKRIKKIMDEFQSEDFSSKKDSLEFKEDL